MKDMTIDNKKISEVLSQIEQDYYDIPFSNTKFQIEKFIINQSLTPERAYRTIGLQLINLIQSLEDSTLSNERLKIDIEEIEYKLKKQSDDNVFEIKRLKIDLISKNRAIERQNKNLNDTIKQIEVYYNYYKNMPKLTREEFEKAEEQYFTQNLHMQAVGINGATEALFSMGYSLNEKGELIKIQGPEPLKIEKIP